MRREKREKAKGERRRKRKRTGRRQEEVESRRMVEIIGNGRMIRAKTPSGRRQRAVALSAAVMESGRQAAGKKLADEKFERKLDGLPKVKVRKMTDDEVVELKGRAVFHRGSAEHRVELPKVDEGKDVKRRVWCGVIGDDGCGMDIVDKNMGVKVENHQIWLMPRKDSLEKLGKVEACSGHLI